MNTNFDSISLDIIHLALLLSTFVFFFIYLASRKTIKQLSQNLQQAQNIQPEVVEKIVEVEKIIEKTVEIETPVEKIVEKQVVLKETGPESALQLINLLQQEARLVDFIHEDLTGFSDADVGAAARVVHEGSKKALTSYFTFASVRDEQEETQITLPEGFNASEVTLTGNVAGAAPFTGVLIHKGWKVTDIRLPQMTEHHDAKIVAPAEVEL